MKALIFAVFFSIIAGPSLAADGWLISRLNMAMCLDFMGGVGTIRRCQDLRSQTFVLPDNRPRLGQIKVSGYCVQLTGHGQQLRAVQCTNANTQIWEQVDGRGWLRNPATKLCIDIRGGQIAAGTPVIGWPCQRSENQAWVLGPVERAPPKTLRPLYAQNMCLDLDVRNENLILWNCHGQANQQFAMPSGPQAGNIRVAGQCVSTLNEGTKLITGRDRCERGGENARWIADGTGTIRNEKWRTCITVLRKSRQVGAAVGVEPCTPGNEAQIFRRK